MLQNEWWDGGSVGQEGPDRRVQRAGSGFSTPPHCTASSTPSTSTTLHVTPVLYYGPAPCPDPFVPARHDNVFITARTLPHLYLVNWPGRKMAKVLMTNNLGSAVEAGMLADLSHLRDHSLPWFLSDHPDATCVIFSPQSLSFYLL